MSLEMLESYTGMRTETIRSTLHRLAEEANVRFDTRLYHLTGAGKHLWQQVLNANPEFSLPPSSGPNIP